MHVMRAVLNQIPLSLGSQFFAPSKVPFSVVAIYLVFPMNFESDFMVQTTYYKNQDNRYYRNCMTGLAKCNFLDECVLLLFSFQVQLFETW